MKIRNGHVSNSSTASFCGIGIELEGSRLSEIIGIAEEIHEHGLEYSFVPPENRIIVGKGFNNLLSDETFNEFKLRTELAIQDLFDDPCLEAVFIEKSWQD